MGFLKSIFTFVLFAFLLMSNNVYASCYCACVNGQVQAICQSSIDLQPICSPTICPIVPPSIQPIGSPTIPPIGTQECHQAQVYNPNTGRYEWQTVCQ